MSIIAEVQSVQSERQGVVATAWVGNQMTVDNAADLDRSGGVLSPDDGVTLYVYTGNILEGLTEDDSDVVEMEDTAPDGWPVPGQTDEDGQPVPTDVRLDLWPEVLDMHAQVAIGDDTVPVNIQHSLRPLLAEGLRDPEDREQVRLEKVGSTYMVSDVLSRRPEMQGTPMYWPDKSLPHVELTGNKIEVHKADEEGNEIVTTSLGGEDGDFLQLSNDGVSPSVSFSSDGSGVLNTLEVGSSMSIGGTDFNDYLSPLPGGLVARQKLGSSATANSLKFNNNELGTSEIIWDCYPGRVYRVTFYGMMSLDGAGAGYARLRATSSPRHDVVPSAPSLNSPQYSTFNINASAAGAYPVRMEAFIGPYDGVYRVGLSGQTNSSTRIGTFISHDNWPSQFYVEDVGTYSDYDDGGVNTMGGTPYSGTSNSGGTSTKTYTTTWTSSASRSWRGSSQDNSVMAQGYYGGYQRYSVLIFPAGVVSTLSGATIKSVQFYIKNLSWYASAGGYARIGHYDSGSLPSSPQTSGGGAFTSPKWAPGAGMWVNLPSGWWSGIKSGAIRGVTLGEGAGTSGNYYGKFATAANLRITYVK